MDNTQRHQMTAANVAATGGDPNKAPDADQVASRRRNDIVSRHNQTSRRVMRFIKRFWIPILVVFLWWFATLNQATFNAVLLLFQFVFQLVSIVLLMIVQFGAIFWFMSQTKVELIKPGDPKSVTFRDYKGQERLVEMVKQWLALLYDRTEFQEMGGKFINGILLYGPPGTGKTLLAKCMAGEAGVAFISMEGSGFRGMFWGMDVLRMMSFINKARRLAREFGACIAFIDEIDAVGASRGGVMGGRQTGMGMGGMMGGGTGALTRLLYEMDGVEEKTRWEVINAKIHQWSGRKPPPRDWHVLFMGSTNRPNVLDPALTRPGRFDRAIEVAPPDKTGRRAIIEYYLSKIRHDETIDVEAIVQDTVHATPAKIMAAISKDAVRLALFDGRFTVNQRDIDLAFQEQSFGLERPIEEMPDDQRRQLAFHEAGHAVATHYYRPEHRIVRTTIVGRGGALGYVQHVPKFEEYTFPTDKIIADIMVSMAGHVATKVFLGEYWIGASSDFQKIRWSIRRLAEFGHFGPPVSNPYEIQPKIGADDVFSAFWADCDRALERFFVLHGDETRALAEALLERESLTGQEVLDVLAEARGELVKNGHGELVEGETAVISAVSEAAPTSSNDAATHIDADSVNEEASGDAGEE
ncbi:MAG: AAA family ATPase [Chloroflexota bacterium]